MLEIVYEDEQMIAINKPHGLLVHRSAIARDATEFALQILRDQIGQKVFPVHRLDRKTGGVLLFAKSEEKLKGLQQAFWSGEVKKYYLAIVRGWTDDVGKIEYALTNDRGKEQAAITYYQTLNRTELPVPFGKFETSRYSLVKVNPITGRMHQIRKHFAHILHPIIADRPHGCNKQNKLFKEKWNMETMLLHAYRLELSSTDEIVRIKAGIQSEFKRMLLLMGWQLDPALFV
ncbi:MAG: pseudouridylate synthase [Cyclobacteriaceae bacterium]